MHVREILRRLQGARPVRGGYLARCPAHEDHKPSLSISEKNGRILVHCHTGCTAEAIVGALGLSMADLFTDSAPDDKGTREYRKPVTVAELAAAKKLPVEFLKEFGLQDSTDGVLISYRLADGSPASRHRVRSHLDHVKGWCWWTGKHGAIVPYGLNHLADAQKARHIVLVEGESDLWTLAYHGFPALGIPGAEMCKTLSGEHLQGISKVFVLQEADAGGSAFLAGVNWRLQEIGWTGETRFVSLAPVKDVNDLHCADPEKFKAAFQAALDSAQRPAKVEGGFRLTSLGDLMREPEEEVFWLLEGILPAGGLSLVAAKPKTGKSTLARCLALAVARGEEFLGRVTQKGAVIYLALEEKRSEVRAHFKAMNATGEEELFIHAASAPVDALPAITVEVQRHKPVLLIIDPALRFVRVKDANDYAQVSAALEPIMALARENGAHVLLVYHAGKGERLEATDAILGSTAFFAAVDTALVMKRTEKFRTLQSRQRYGDDLAETTLEFKAESRTIVLGVPRSDAEAEGAGRGILAFLQAAGEQKTEQEIREAVKGETKILAEDLRELVKEGKVTREGAGKRGNPYRYGFSFACSEDTVQTSKRETETVAETRVNTEPTLVRASEQKPILVLANGEAPKPALSARERAGRDPLVQAFLKKFDCEILSVKDLRPTGGIV